MKRSLKVVIGFVLASALAGCQTTFYEAGTTPITLSPTVVAGFEKYKQIDYPLFFAVSTNGRGYAYYWCDSIYCDPDSSGQAISLCERQSQSGGLDCKIFAFERSIVWKGPITYPGTRPDNIGVKRDAEPTEWAGVISGGGGGCTSFSIEMTIDKDGGIVGEAAHHATGTVWDVSGMVDKSNFVNIRIEDIGDVARSRAVGKLPWLALAGHLTGSSLSIAQPSSRSCDPPRSGVLKRL